MSRPSTAPTPERGLQFPGRFEITAMGASNAGLETLVIETLAAAGLAVQRHALRSRASTMGNYVAVTVAFDAAVRSDYERAHQVLRSLHGVKWTL